MLVGRQGKGNGPRPVVVDLQALVVHPLGHRAGSQMVKQPLDGCRGEALSGEERVTGALRPRPRAPAAGGRQAERAQQGVEDRRHPLLGAHAVEREHEKRGLGARRLREPSDLPVHLPEDLHEAFAVERRGVVGRVRRVDGVPQEVRALVDLGEDHEQEVEAPSRRGAGRPACPEPGRRPGRRRPPGGGPAHRGAPRRRRGPRRRGGRRRRLSASRSSDAGDTVSRPSSQSWLPHSLISIPVGRPAMGAKGTSRTPTVYPSSARVFQKGVRWFVVRCAMRIRSGSHGQS